jgi:hypothetical protein
MPKVDMPRPPDPQLDPAGYLRSLNAVRERSKLVTDKALRNDLKHFDVDMGKFPDVVTFVSQIIKVSIAPSFGYGPVPIATLESKHLGWSYFCLAHKVRIADLPIPSSVITMLLSPIFPLMAVINISVLVAEIVLPPCSLRSRRLTFPRSAVD